jgi:hypothetical protein
MADLHQNHVNGNGHGGHYVSRPQARRAFRRDLPDRLGGLEGQLNTHGKAVDEFRTRLAAIERRGEDRTLVGRIELAHLIVELVCLLLGKSRPRRRILPILD